MDIFFKTNQEQKSYVQRKLRTIYPDFISGGDHYRSFIKEYIKDAVVVDAGCGDSGIIAEFKNEAKQIIGVDLSQPLLELNNIVDEKIHADLIDIPLQDNSVDIIVSEFVLEHVEYPAPVFHELYRILKPGGVFIFLTPNVNNPVMMASRVLPHGIHVFFRKHVLKKEEETHPTCYRANTYKTLKTLGNNAGFETSEIKRAGNPEYIGCIKPFVRPSILLERFLAKKRMQRFQMYLIGCFKK